MHTAQFLMSLWKTSLGSAHLAGLLCNRHSLVGTGVSKLNRWSCGGSSSYTLRVPLCARDACAK